MTSWTTKPGHDANPMSRPPFQPNNDKPGRDFKTGSRPQIQLAKNHNLKFSGRNSKRPSHIPTSNPCRDLKTRSRHQIHIVLLRRQNPRSPSLRPTATQLGRDATSWSRPHAQPNQVATSNRCRDLKSMSRPQIGPNLQRSHIPGRNPSRSYTAQLGRDAHFWSLPQAAPQGF